MLMQFLLAGVRIDHYPRTDLGRAGEQAVFAFSSYQKTSRAEQETASEERRPSLRVHVGLGELREVRGFYDLRQLDRDWGKSTGDLSPSVNLDYGAGGELLVVRDNRDGMVIPVDSGAQEVTVPNSQYIIQMSSFGERILSVKRVDASGKEKPWELVVPGCAFAQRKEIVHFDDQIISGRDLLGFLMIIRRG